MRGKGIGMKRYITLAMILLLTLLASGCSCSAKDGGGWTWNKDGIHFGTSLSERDRIAKERAQAEIENGRKATDAKNERDAKNAEANREMLKGLGIAAAIALGVVGMGHAGKLAAPLAAQGVAGLETALAVRKAKRFEISLDVTRDSCQAHFLAEGYSDEEIAQIVHNAPALDAPRVQQLQIRAGYHGMQALADRGELEETLVRLPIDVDAEVAEG